MPLVSRLWNSAKWWGQTFCGMAKVAVKPNEPIPPTLMHPRMPPMSSTVGEFVRMFPWRYYWVHHPLLRLFLTLLPAFSFVYFVYIPHLFPRIKPALRKIEEGKHHLEEHLCYGFNQRKQDKLYFEKHDPLHKFRPQAYDLVYRKGGH